MTDTPTEREGEGAWARLRRRKVVQWGLAYAAGAWALLQVIGFAADTFDCPRQIRQFASIGLAVGLPVVLVVAWYHGDRGRQRVSGAEIAILSVLALAPFQSALSERSRPAPLAQPTEAQLGAPVYPGAVYQPDISCGMSQRESYYQVFVTSDPASKVAAFYMAKTGVAATEVEGTYMFTIKKGSNPYFPDHGLVIEPNKQLTAGPPKTAITFSKKK